jgi:hypothetical protein
VLDLLELMLSEHQLERSGEVLDRRNLGQDLTDPFLQQPVERLALDTDQIGKGEDLGNLGERHAGTSRNDLVRQERSLLGRNSTIVVERRRHANLAV